MIPAASLWVVFTLLAAAGQTARNAMQRELTAALGTVGATHVRFLFGFPFALLFLAGVLIAIGAALPTPGPIYIPWILLGAGAPLPSSRAPEGKASPDGLSDALLRSEKCTT